MTITIYHNPACGTSRNTLGLIRNSGEEPVVIEYLKTPPSRAELVSLIQRMGIAPRDLLRRKGTPYDALGLDDPTLLDDAVIDAMMAHPILINRPIVVTSIGVKLCRPSTRAASGSCRDARVCEIAEGIDQGYRAHRFGRADRNRLPPYRGRRFRHHGRTPVRR
jgi:arsenate reductase